MALPKALVDANDGKKEKKGVPSDTQSKMKPGMMLGIGVGKQWVQWNKQPGMKAGYGLGEKT